MLPAIQESLDQCAEMLHSISDRAYADSSVAPYYSSIGAHVRHALDIYNCILSGADRDVIDLTARSRDVAIEQQRMRAMSEIINIQRRLEGLLGNRASTELVRVRDDLGKGHEVHTYTLGGALIQAHSHLLHHMAVVGYLLASLGETVPGSGFGINPTTPANAINS